MKVIVYIERPDQTLVRNSTVEVPDNTADPTAEAWRLIQRNALLPQGDYVLAAKPIRVKLADKRTQVGTNLGPVT